MTRVRNVFWILIASLLIQSIAFTHQEVKFVKEFGGKGNQTGRFGETVFIAFDRNGGICVTDTDNSRIQKLDANGHFLFEIKSTDSEKFIFINPTDIAVGEDGSIYVMDWIITQIEDSKILHDDGGGAGRPKMFNYGPCVHRFDSNGDFVVSYPIQDFSKRVQSLERAVPGLDAEGNYALVIPQGDTERSFLLAVDNQENLYIFDAGKIHKLAANNQSVTTFTTAQPRVGQVLKAADMAVDQQGNLYIVDEAAHRVLKFDSNGQFSLSFGEYGDRAGQFISPFHLIALDDETVLVADKANYKKDFVSDLPRRLYDPFQFGGYPYRVFRARFRCVQRFYADGQFAERILIRFSRENEKQANLRLKGINYRGNLYFIDTETLKFRQFAPTSALIASAFQTEVKLRYAVNVEDVEIDNRDDLDADLFSKADFDGRVRLHRAGVEATLAYDFNEDLRFAISNNLVYYKSIDESFYRARDFEDFRGTFNQDDESTDEFWEDRVQFGATLIRSHNPYTYREASAFTYFNIMRTDFINDAFDPQNFRFFDFRARLSDWGAGLRYDLSKAFHLDFSVAHFFGYNEFTYIDETNVLYATGFQQGDETSAVLMINGVF